MSMSFRTSWSTEFQDSQSYPMRPCLKTNITKTNKQDNSISGYIIKRKESLKVVFVHPLSYLGNSKYPKLKTTLVFAKSE